MSQPSTEKYFEDHIEAHLLKSGYEKLPPQVYNKEVCLITTEVIAFLQDTQSDEYDKLWTQYGVDTPAKVVYRLSIEISKRGTLDVFRTGFKDRGCHFKLAYFKPSSGMNPKHEELYRKNRFSLVRQLQFSQKTSESIDIVLFLNGIPIITHELKNSLTGQFVEEAVKQYKNRDFRETFFQFKRCLCHFAVGNEKVHMTTRLSGDDTKFLPFNKDIENPINPNGFKTAYLWEDILQPDTLLCLLGTYLHVQLIKEKYFDKQKGLTEKEYEVLIFPRYHQLDAVRKILAGVKQEGVGKCYLVQHSAGSGKSNSIAWLAHQLASFYRTASDKDRLFDSIIVVTDRKNLDRQLQNTIKQFEQTKGVVNPIDVDSKQLKEMLEGGKDIIISTVQKFPRISASIANLKGKRFAVIVDEAHTSQTGESAKHLKKTLASDLPNAEKADSDTEDDIEDAIEKEIKMRGKQPNISYFAFTATPKNKTLELFGRKNSQGKFEAYHIYSMRQAIEEQFILDVLENYTTFERYFKLIKSVPQDTEYQKKKTVRLLKSYVDLQPHAIETKTRIMLEHFLEATGKAIQGRGRAMVVTRSRLHAVKFFQMFKKIMLQKNLPYKPLVAFSGSVKDPDTDAEHTENSLNHLPPKVRIEDAFKTPEYRLLIVANKFQTGFDEPYLHTMYVDKKLGGVNAVQTLSRLNRTAKGKTETVVLDFVNEAEDIQKAFQVYYQKVYLEKETDPNKLYDLQRSLERFEVFTEGDVNAFALIFFNPKEKPEALQPILDQVVARFNAMTDEDAREDFRSNLQSYIRLYGFISQLVTFKDIGLEKLFVFSKSLNQKLPRRKGVLPVEVLQSVDLDSFRIQQTYSGSIELEPKDGETKPIDAGTPKNTEDPFDFLSAIVQSLNDAYGTNLTEEDKVDIQYMQEKLTADDALRSFMHGDNSRENKKYKFDKTVDDLLLTFVNTKLELYRKLTDPKVNPMFKEKWFEGYERKAINE